MPFNQKLQKFNAKINTVTIGSGDKTVTIGGDSTYPFYSFDAPSENTPKIGVEISDMGLENVVSEGIKAYYDGASTIGEMAKKAAAMEGADFVALILEGGDPNGVNKSVDELIAVVKDVADSIDAPLVVEGCGTSPESSRSPSGKKCPSSFRKRRKLQSNRCCSRTCLRSDRRCRICRRYQPC